MVAQLVKKFPAFYRTHISYDRDSDKGTFKVPLFLTNYHAMKKHRILN